MPETNKNGQPPTDPRLDAVICTIAGRVWHQVTENAATIRKPIAGATVQIKDSGRATETDGQGRFQFKNLSPGQYTLVVQTAAGGSGERIIQVPPDYDVEVADPVVSTRAATEPAADPSAPPPVAEEPAPEPSAPAPQAADPADEPPAVVQVGIKSAEPAPPKAGRRRKQASTTE